MTVRFATAAACCLAVTLAVAPPPIFADAPAATATADPCHCHYTDRAALIADAEAIVRDVIARAGAELPFTGKPPVVRVETTPALIWIDLDEQPAVIRLPWWDDLPSEVRDSFRRWAGGDEARARPLFDALFHRFLIAHETAHWLRAQRRGAELPDTFYDAEDQANRVASAYWQATAGGPAFLAELETALLQMRAALRDPTPPGEDPARYFGTHYATLGSQPDDYAYYQTVFTLRAVQGRAELRLADLVAEMAPPASTAAAR